MGDGVHELVHEVGVGAAMPAVKAVARGGAKGGCDVVGQGVAHVVHGEGGAAVFGEPGVVLKAALGAIEAKALVIIVDDLAVLADAHGAAVGHLEEGGLVGVALVGPRKVAIVGKGAVAKAGYALGGHAAHDMDGATGGVGGIGHGAADDAALAVGVQDLGPFLADGAGGAQAFDLAQVATARVKGVVVVAFGKDKVAKGALGSAALTVHGDGAVDGGLAQHIVQAGALHGADELVAPVEDLVGIGDRGDGHGAVDVLAVFQGGQALGRVQPGLGDDYQRVQVRGEQIVELGGAGGAVELGPPGGAIGKAGDTIGLAVA